MITLKWYPSGRVLRLFAWSLALILAVIGWQVRHPTSGFWLRVTAALVFTLGTVWPGLFRWSFRLLLVPAYLLGKVVTAKPKPRRNVGFGKRIRRAV